MVLLLRKHLNPMAIGALLLVIFAVARIVATYRVFNQTFDEPAHIACGLEWLDEGQYRYEHQHPPLARVAAALGGADAAAVITTGTDPNCPGPANEFAQRGHSAGTAVHPDEKSRACASFSSRLLRR